MGQHFKNIKRVFTRTANHLIRNTSTTLLGLLLLFLLITSYATILYHNNVSKKFRELIERKYPAEVLFCRTNDKEIAVANISENFVSDVLRVSHIQSYNRTNTFNAQVIAIGYNGRQKEDKFDQTPFVIQTDINTSLNSFFMSGQLELLGGQFPDTKNKGILVDSDYLGLDIDSYNKAYIRFKILSEDGTFFMELPVVGIYKTLYPLERIVDGVPVKQNAVFMNESAITSISDKLIAQDSMKFYLDSHDALDEVMNELNEIKYDHKNYRFFPSLSLDVSSQLNSIRVGEASQKIFLAIYWIISTGIIVVYLVNDYLKYRKNIRIYSLLGERTRRIICEYCIRILMIFGIACFPSTVFALLFQPVISKNIINNITQPLSEGSFYTTFELQRGLLQKYTAFNVSWAEINGSLFYILIVIAVFLIIVGVILSKKRSMILVVPHG